MRLFSGSANSHSNMRTTPRTSSDSDFFRFRGHGFESSYGHKLESQLLEIPLLDRFNEFDEAALCLNLPSCPAKATVTRKLLHCQQARAAPCLPLPAGENHQGPPRFDTAVLHAPPKTQSNVSLPSP